VRVYTPGGKVVTVAPVAKFLHATVPVVMPVGVEACVTVGTAPSFAGYVAVMVRAVTLIGSTFRVAEPVPPAP